MASWLDFFQCSSSSSWVLVLIMLLCRNYGNSICTIQHLTCHCQSAEEQRSKKKNSSGVEPAGERSTTNLTGYGLSGIMKRKGKREQGMKEVRLEQKMGRMMMVFIRSWSISLVWHQTFVSQKSL